MSELSHELESKPWVEAVKETNDGYIVLVEREGERDTVRWFYSSPADVVAQIPPGCESYVWLLKEDRGSGPRRDIARYSVINQGRNDSGIQACVSSRALREMGAGVGDRLVVFEEGGEFKLRVEEAEE